MPKREKELQVKRIAEEDLRYWAEQTLAPNPEVVDERKDEQLAHRVPNLADITSVIDFYIRVHNQELYQALMSQAKDISVLRQILTDKTEITEEEIKEYEADFEEKMEADRKIMEKIQELQAKGEDLSEEDMKELQALVGVPSGEEDQTEEA